MNELLVYSDGMYIYWEMDKIEVDGIPGVRNRGNGCHFFNVVEDYLEGLEGDDYPEFIDDSLGSDNPAWWSSPFVMIFDDSEFDESAWLRYGHI